jgi:hypothetical protein
MADRKAAALAGTMVSALSAAVAIGANFGLFGLATQPEPRIGTFIPASLSREAAEPAPEPAPQPESQDQAQPMQQPAPVASASALDDGPGRAAGAPPTVTPAAPQAPQPPTHPDHDATGPAQAATAQDHRSSNSGRGSGERGRAAGHTEDSADDHGNDDHRAGDDD